MGAQRYALRYVTVQQSWRLFFFLPQRRAHSGWLATMFHTGFLPLMDVSSGFVLISLTHPEKMTEDDRARTKKKLLILPAGGEVSSTQEQAECPLC